MNPLLINVIKAIAALAETPWKNRKSQALRRVIDQLVEISDCLAPLPHAPEDLEDFQQNLQALASTVEELDNTVDELQTADSPQETTSAVEMLDEQLSTALELLSKLSNIGQIIEATEEELTDTWLPRIRQITTMPMDQRPAALEALLLQPTTNREAVVIRRLIREVFEEKMQSPRAG